MDQQSMAHLLHGIRVSLEKVAAPVAPLRGMVAPLAPVASTSKLLALKNPAGLFGNPYFRAAAPAAFAGLTAGGLASAIGDDVPWYAPLLGLGVGATAGLGARGAMNRGLIPAKYHGLTRTALPVMTGAGLLGSQLFDNSTLGATGGIALGGASTLAINKLLGRRFGGIPV